MKKILQGMIGLSVILGVFSSTLMGGDKDPEDLGGDAHGKPRKGMVAQPLRGDIPNVDDADRYHEVMFVAHPSAFLLVRMKGFLVYPNYERGDEKCLSLIQWSKNESGGPKMIEAKPKWRYPAKHRGERRLVLVDQDTFKTAELLKRLSCLFLRLLGVKERCSLFIARAF